MNPIFNPRIATPICIFLIADALFHFVPAGKYDDKLSFLPDWLMTKGLFDTIGLPGWMHQFSGVLMIASCAYVLWLVYKRKSLRTHCYANVFLTMGVPFAFFVIFTGWTLKICMNRKEKQLAEHSQK